MNPGHVTEQRKVMGRRTIKTDAVDLEAMTELLKELRGLYIEMRDQGATPARLERMRALINTYGAGRYVKGHVRA